MTRPSPTNRSSEELDHSLRVATWVAGGIAHELNNSASVSALATTLIRQAAQAGDPLDAQDLDACGEAANQVALCARALNRLFQAQTRTGPEVLRLDLVVGDLLRALDASGRCRGVNLVAPPRAPPASVRCSPIDLDQLVLGLVVPSLAHARHHGHTVSLSLHTDLDRATLEVELLTPPGETLAPDAQALLGDPDWRREVAARWGGTVSWSAEPGRIHAALRLPIVSSG
jgi:hypothetical protein